MGWGSSTRRGGGQKVRALPRKFVFLGFRGREPGMSREFCRDVPDSDGVQKVCAKKVRTHFSFPSHLCRMGPWIGFPQQGCWNGSLIFSICCFLVSSSIPFLLFVFHSCYLESVFFLFSVCLQRKMQGGPGSVRFGYGLEMERFKRLRFSVLAVPLGIFSPVFQYSLTGKNGSGFGSGKTGPAVPVPLSVSGKTVPTVPVSGSGSVPEPP